MDDLSGFPVARFNSELLPEETPTELTEAARAVRSEYQNCSKWKRLTCERVSVYAERDRGTVFMIDVGGAVEFDWTWEGAVAFRPKSIDEFGMLSDSVLENTVHDDQIVWSGEILEVNQQDGLLFVAIADPDRLPVKGSFFVRPFEFLAVLDAVYNDARFELEQAVLPRRLDAAEGGLHPLASGDVGEGLPELNSMWGHGWSVLWGPPGTGKTYTIGRQVASIVGQDANERILIVSTTNKATDAVAKSIGLAAKQLATEPLREGKLLRIGKGASFQQFATDDLLIMLQGTESSAMAKLDQLTQTLATESSLEQKALTRKQIKELKLGANDRSGKHFLDPDVRCVVSTAFKATTMLSSGNVKSIIEKEEAPFTTVVIDEAGLISRVAVAALSLLAAKRVVLVGDSKQLAPISRISRVLPKRQQKWLASSGLTHLDNVDPLPDAVHLLSEQRRMHPDICRVVSYYQYDGALTTAPERAGQESNLPEFIQDFSRAIWYVLDTDAKNLATIRAQRGSGNRSWARKGTLTVLQKLLSTELRNCDGLFISPFSAQAKEVADQLRKWKLKTWEASTVHSQQGSEADVVIFDTVNAGSYGWPYQEWKRLINVALSRAREAVIVLASRSEMDEPYLKPLVEFLTPAVMQKTGGHYRWKALTNSLEVDAPLEQQLAAPDLSTANPDSMGWQFDQRRRLKPVLSKEQQRLVNLELDGKPRLIRGVAGSGKSYVLCRWLVKTVQRFNTKSGGKVWLIYSNRSLHQLLRQTVEYAWQSHQEQDLFGVEAIPWHLIEVLHVKDILAGLLPEASLSIDRFDFDYDRAAEEFLKRVDIGGLATQCTALFIDEAQDMGPATIRLLLSLVEQSDPDDANSRSAHIFYDNAQNIYGRKTPKWSDFGLDMRGRSTIMRESFRSTRPITELAINVLDQLSEPGTRQDQAELKQMGLVDQVLRGGQTWLSVQYNQVSGPVPIFQRFDQRVVEIDRIAKHIGHLTREESVRPTDICIIYNGQQVADDLLTRLGPMLASMGIELSLQKNRSFERNHNTLVMTTSHSFKGYESEVVIIPAVDQFVTGQGQILANNLYVAMTRARSLLAIYGTRAHSSAGQKVIQTIQRCREQLIATPLIDVARPPKDKPNED